jgi:Xaa-Pro dipeptidase
MDEHGMKPHRYNACGYSLGAKFTPSWMDFPMFFAGNPVKLARNQVFFLHMIVMDSASGKAFSLGRTYIVSRDKPEPLSKYPLGMILR